MKKPPRTKRAAPRDDDMRAEYRFDYRRARPNPYAASMQNTIAVVLDPDVAAVFQTGETVNTALRSLIAALPAAVRDSVTEYARRPPAKPRA